MEFLDYNPHSNLDNKRNLAEVVSNCKMNNLRIAHSPRKRVDVVPTLAERCQPCQQVETTQ